MSADMNNNNSFNSNLVEVERLADLNLSPFNNTNPNDTNSSTIDSISDKNNSLLNEKYINASLNESSSLSGVRKSLASNLVLTSSFNNKNNSFNAKKVKSSSTVPSQSTPRLANVEQSFTSPEQIFQSNKTAGKKDNDRVKQLLRMSYWPINHSIRKGLWKSILQQSQQTNYEKENNGSLKNNHWNFNELDYNRNLSQIFGKCMISCYILFHHFEI